MRKGQEGGTGDHPDAVKPEEVAPTSQHKGEDSGWSDQSERTQCVLRTMMTGSRSLEERSATVIAAPPSTIKALDRRFKSSPFAIRSKQLTKLEDKIRFSPRFCRRDPPYPILLRMSRPWLELTDALS